MNAGRFLVLCCLALGILSCADEPVIAPMDCRVKTALHINTLDQLVVTYELSSTGEHAVSQWFYYGPDGKVIVLSPELPATITVALGPEDSVLAGATGTVKAGSIRVSYRAVAPDTVITASDICIQNLNATPVLP